MVSPFPKHIRRLRRGCQTLQTVFVRAPHFSFVSRRHRQRLWHPAGRQSRPFASMARSHNQSLIERFCASYDPWRRNFPRSGSVFCPSGTLENRTFDREPPGTGSRRSRKGRTQTRSPRWREPAGDIRPVKKGHKKKRGRSRAGPPSLAGVFVLKQDRVRA